VISFNRTLDEVLKLDPGSPLDLQLRASAQPVQAAAAHQRSRPAVARPRKLQILQLAIRRLTEAGYVFIGMDHFAKPNDELAVAQRQGRLHRNFQGYSTHAECRSAGLRRFRHRQGRPELLPERARPSTSTTTASTRASLPIFRGIELNADDLLRAASSRR
jgi:oxygen-independent coproporphyrinogen-3 oxidase